MPPTLDTGEAIIADRVALTALDTTEPLEMPWLEAALAPEWSMADFETARETSDAFLITDREGEPIGVALVRQGEPGAQDATISFLAVQPERRFRGLGGEAGIALDRLLRDGSAERRVYAAVPEGRGLAVYFWLRLGFRPLSTADGPGPPAGLTGEPLAGISMLRDAP